MRFLVLLFALVPLLAAQQYRAYWADGFNRGFKTAAQVDQMIEDVEASRGNAIFMQARLRANSFYLESLEPLAEDSTWSTSFDALKYLIERAHAKGIEVHAWFTITPIWFSTAPPRDARHIFNRFGPSAQGEDMWMTVGSSGRVSPNYVDPGHPGVARHTSDVILHVVKNYDVDGVHLDYIRYPEPIGDSGDHGYNPTALDRFNRLQLRAGRPRSTEAVWTDWRRAQVTNFVRQVYLRVNEVKPQVKVTGAFISWGNGPLNDAGFRGTDAFATVYQDWRGWLEEGIIDIAMPMHYFAEPRNGAFFDRWIEFSKDRQYRRMTLAGLGNYLSPVAGGIAQLQRALAPSAAGNRFGGVCFYSYANTNLQNAAGVPLEPNADFYRGVAGVFGEAVRPPVLPWKARPSTGHLLGQFTVDGGARWMADGVTVAIVSDTTGAVARTTASDATGFYGAVDLAPDRYYVRLLRNGREWFRTPAQDIAAGRTVRFDVRLKPEDLPLPVVSGAVTEAAPANGIVEVRGLNLGGAPLAAWVNGELATVFRQEGERAWLTLPNQAAEQWRIALRQPGVESNSITLPATAAVPEVLGVRRVGTALEIYCIGLGLVANGRPALPVRVTVNGEPVEILAAVGSAGLPLFQVNVNLGSAMARGTIVVRVGETDSKGFELTSVNGTAAASVEGWRRLFGQ